MNAICRCGFQFALALAIPLFASTIPTPAFAYTPEQQQACTPDAMRLCGEYVPDVERITACMIARKSQLSPECRQFFRPGPERERSPTRRPTSSPWRASRSARSRKSRKSQPQADLPLPGHGYCDPAFQAGSRDQLPLVAGRVIAISAAGRERDFP